MWLSPAATFANVATDLSGTGDESRTAWLEAVGRYSNVLGSALFENPPQVTIRLPGMSMELEVRKLPSISELPAFVPPKNEVIAAVQRALPSIIVLMGYTVLFIIAGFIAFVRYDVR
jgi:hypothetical protein